MVERADLRRRPQRTTVKDILRTAVTLEKKTMALYMQFTRAFQAKEELRKFWFGMARHEASHLGALALGALDGGSVRRHDLLKFRTAIVADILK